MKICYSLFLVFSLVAAALQAVAWDGAEVAEADGYITRWLSYHNTPTPGYCDWRPDASPVQSFQATNADGVGSIPCDDPWFVHCDNDSIVYRAAWPTLDNIQINTSNYESTITCTVDITVQTGAICTRSAVGNLTSDLHTLFIQHPGGEVVTVFDAGAGPDEAQLILEPGTYLVTMTVFASQVDPGGPPFDPYEGHVLLEWVDPGLVAAEPTSWGSIKAIFR